MEIDTSWDSLFNPGKATEFFTPQASQFEVEAPGYSPINAWWLAEISRLVYKQETAEDPHFQGRTRRQILNEAGLEEVAFIHSPDTQCAILKPLDPKAPPFVVLVFRGSHDLRSWLTNIRTRPVARPPYGGLVHQGFGDALEGVIEEIEGALRDLPGPVFYTGHSLGAALATLAAARKPPRAVYAFGSPRVGNKEFKDSLAKKTKLYRVVHSRDIVATAPPAELGFDHCEELHYITRDGRFLVNPKGDLTDAQRFSLFQPGWHLLRAPEELADHAPINYVTRLRSALG
jgi:pimeloyl-ACP methyl ester carboxylesterase